MGKTELTGKSEKPGTFIAETEPTKGSFWSALWESVASGCQISDGGPGAVGLPSQQ